MSEYLVSQIAKVIEAQSSIKADAIIHHLLLDSRKIFAPATSLFFAIKSKRRNGHQFVSELYNRGVRNFVINEEVNTNLYPEANFLLVKNVLGALQQLAAYHRRQFNIPVIGITGSNGKTIVKEWLYQLLHTDFNIVRSPKSYNSQIGVPLSVWQMNEHHTLAIFEAGISQCGEMERLEKIIQPTIGVLTNIGEAHSEGFHSLEEKRNEKQLLFQNCTLPATLNITEVKKKKYCTEIFCKLNENDTILSSIEIPFTDDASIENAITCWQVLVTLKIKQPIIAERMKQLQPVLMRLELKNGINNCVIINDSYSADLSSLEIALNFLDQQSIGVKRTVILSDFLQSSIPDDELYGQVLDLLQRHSISKLIGIGERITAAYSEKKLNMDMWLFSTKEKFVEQFLSSQFKEETILIKGARIFEFEEIVQLLELKAHQTVLEINLNAIAHNLKEYQKILLPETKVMAMVKAFAYGSGSAEIAGVLQYNKVDYLGVAYADEGIELRKAGIHLPIMVMNTEPNAFEKIVAYNLEPDLYSFDILEQFERYLINEGISFYPVHIEIETGMNRLGFSIADLDKLANKLLSTASFTIQSVFTHLAASEEVVNDVFTNHQFTLFNQAINTLKTRTGLTFMSHIANSAAAIRHPQLQMDMVRLGIGLYGIDSAASGKLNLQTVATLKSTIAQIKNLKKGESVSYNRKGILHRDARIATVRIGYADGYPRRLGNGNGAVLVKDLPAPIVGTICMDMFMIDVTDIPEAKEGDDVIIFGNGLSVEKVASNAGTISYEILTGISQRVKRVYFEE
ncbi:MAG: alanine racemase [Bacteroidetes bacterium]|nr:alanine racemase [Bacteroidota bacterium]